MKLLNAAKNSDIKTLSTHSKSKTKYSLQRQRQKQDVQIAKE